MAPVLCDSCGARFSADSLSEDDYRALQDQHSYREFNEELRMLLNVRAFYRRFPEAEGRIRPHVVSPPESDDLRGTSPCCHEFQSYQLELQPEHIPGAWSTEQHREVVNYLQRHAFSLGPRLEFVQERISELRRSLRSVACPNCPTGTLHVPPADCAEFLACNAITWYWPHWHEVDSDGTLFVKKTGWQGGGRVHWTGEIAINPQDPNYDFFRWLVTRKEYHRIVEEAELSTIREEWLRSSGGTR